MVKFKSNENVDGGGNTNNSDSTNPTNPTDLGQEGME